MKSLFLIGLILLVVGLASFVVPFPRTDRDSIKAGPIELGVETKHNETMPQAASAILVIGGIILLIAGKKAKA